MSLSANITVLVSNKDDFEETETKQVFDKICLTSKQTCKGSPVMHKSFLLVQGSVIGLCQGSCIAQPCRAVLVLLMELHDWHVFVCTAARPVLLHRTGHA